ncbi:transglycosylase family protein [Streptomyces sp. NPDC003006]
MLSGNGRHRRPRQAPALIVAAGVTGSAIAIPLLGATSASAAETATWDKLAECESGGAWSANPGNGYYGGLQLSQETWERHGGLDYAPSADQASKSQQIAVAEKILDGQGPAAWPSCAPIAGLTNGGAAADVDPGDPVVPDSSGSTGSEKSPDKGKGTGEDANKDASKDANKDADKSDGKSSGSADPSDDASSAPGSSSGDGDGDDASDTPGSDGASRDKNHDKTGNKGSTGNKGTEGDQGKTDGKTDGKGEAGDPGKSGRKDSTSPGSEDPATPTDDTASGRHRGDRADETASGDRPGRHASRGADRTEKLADGTYKVRSGDNLSAIADDLDVDGGWRELYTENKKTVGGDPDLILPGQSLDLGEK